MLGEIDLKSHVYIPGQKVRLTHWPNLHILPRSVLVSFSF